MVNLSTLYSHCNTPDCTQGVPSYEDFALDPPGGILTGKNYPDHVAIVAVPYEGLKYEDMKPSQAGNKLDLPPSVSYRKSPPIKMTADATTLGRNDYGIPEAFKSDGEMKLISYPRERIMKQSDILKHLEKEESCRDIQFQKVAYVKDPSKKVTVDANTLNRLYYHQNSAAAYAARDKATRKYVAYPNSRVEYRIHSLDEPFNGWGDERLNFIVSKYIPVWGFIVFNFLFAMGGLPQRSFLGVEKKLQATMSIISPIARASKYMHD